MGQVNCRACELQTEGENQYVRASSPLGIRNSVSSTFRSQGSSRSLPPLGSSGSTKLPAQEKKDANRPSLFELRMESSNSDPEQTRIASTSMEWAPVGHCLSQLPAQTQKQQHNNDENDHDDDDDDDDAHSHSRNVNDFHMPIIRELSVTDACLEGRNSISETTTTSSEGSEENDKENQAEISKDAATSRESKEERRRRKELRRREKWLLEQEVEAERRREVERQRKEEQRRIAREACLIEERRLEELQIQKRQQDAKKLEAFLIKHNYVSINSKRKKEARKWGKYDYPLHKAVELADEEMVRILLDFGADTEVKNNNKKQPVDKARKLKMENWEIRESIITMLENSDSVSSYFRSNASTACSSGHLAFSGSGLSSV